MQKIIVAGYVSRVQGSSEWMHDDITIQLLSMTIIGLLLLTFAGLTYTFLGPINSKRLKIMFANHPSSIWNRCFATTIGLLMVKGDVGFVSADTNRSNVIAFYQSRFAESIRYEEFAASERLLDKLTILTPQFSKLESNL